MFRPFINPYLRDRRIQNIPLLDDKRKKSDIKNVIKRRKARGHERLFVEFLISKIESFAYSVPPIPCPTQ